MLGGNSDQAFQPWSWRWFGTASGEHRLSVDTESALHGEEGVLQAPPRWVCTWLLLRRTPRHLACAVSWELCYSHFGEGNRIGEAKELGGSDPGLLGLRGRGRGVLRALLSFTQVPGAALRSRLRLMWI